jgi:hypothetical protein
MAFIQTRPVCESEGIASALLRDIDEQDWDPS